MAEELPPIDPAEFKKVVETRRSIRLYTEETIPEDVMRQCLDLALLAPSSFNLQPWEFYWVRSPEKKKKLVEACLSQSTAKTAAELVVCVARRKTWRKNRKEILERIESENLNLPESHIQYYKILIPFFYTQGFLDTIGFLKSILYYIRGLFVPTPREPVSINDMKIWAVKASALACENLMLALRAFGYDSCPLEFHDSSRIKKLLDLSSDAIITMVITAGKRAPNGLYGDRTRLDKLHFIREV
ncbi:MAG TPA: nitroreductase family protein [Leptospiraceae bacterium]|nr:nitroreductase family protein [Leptospiraceae bacterium]HMW05223.1 nitroreductase family protein [Leptospiraceae bacterium]HMX31312.1 nitroreductase family protein [Leptospiraceae bacterium]HMY32118.1 nitroreductase family protein [Leptospiraceae bacterium]HNA05518.1 nitroreductase family protein [Leptospiraceae bacterium]